MTVSLSLVVVTWQSEEDLRALIKSMNRHLADPAGVELVIVDNASDLDPSETASVWKGPVEVIRLETNIGFGRAANQGVRAASAPVTVICNPDVVLEDASLIELGDLALRRSALTGPRLLWPDGSDQPSASGPVTGIWPWVGALIPGSIQPRSILEKTEPWRCSHTIEVEWLTGAVIAGPTHLMRDLGPFDERIDMMSEDLDLCLRASESGVPCLFAPDVARVTHKGATARRKRFRDEGLMLSALNRADAIERARGRRAAALGQAAVKVRLTLRSWAKALTGRDRASETAELEGLRLASNARKDR